MLKNDVVSLRPIEYRDLEILNKWRCDFSTFKYLGGGFNPVSPDQQRKWLDSLMDNTGRNRRYIVENACGEAVGFIGLYDIHEIHRTAELGMYIGSEEDRGKGYGKNSYELLEEFAKNYLNIRKIKCYTVVENEAISRTLGKRGYNVCGILKKERFIDGEFKDVELREKLLWED